MAGGLERYSVLVAQQDFIRDDGVSHALDRHRTTEGLETCCARAVCEDYPWVVFWLLVA